MLPLTHISIDNADPGASWSYTHALPIVTWRGVDQACALMVMALNTACCAALCGRLRMLAAQMRAEAPTPAQGMEVRRV